MEDSVSKQETASEARLSASERRKHAVIVRKKSDGKTEYKFPIPDKLHARQALRMINQSDLTEAEKKKVRARAKEVLGKEYENWENDPTPYDEMPYNSTVAVDESVEEFPSTNEGQTLTFVADEARGGIGSVGGQDPRAKKKPLRYIVRAFGKWARGKQSTCVRVLTTRHPELCAGRPGGCNALCAYLKDQFLGTTKWRKGQKKNLVRRALEGYVEIDGEEWVLPEDMALDALAVEADRQLNGPVEPPEWLTEELEQKLVEIMEKDLEGTELSYGELAKKLHAALSAYVKNQSKGDNDGIVPQYATSVWVHTKDIYSSYVIFKVSYYLGEERGETLYRQNYRVESENVILDGDPTKVVHAYVSAESDVDEPVSETSTNLNKRIDEVGVALRKHFPKEHVWPREVHTSFVIFNSHPRLDEKAEVPYALENEKVYRVSYKRDSEGNVLFHDDRVEVEQVYRPVKESETEETSTSDEEVVLEVNEANDDYVLVDEGNGNVAVRIDEDNKIISGPKHLVGVMLPPIPSNEEEAGEGEGEGELLVEESEASMLEITETEFTTSVDEVSEEKLETPNGQKVDAIVRIITPGPGNKRDRFYYTEESIRSTVKVFEGKKMYKNHLTRSQIQASEGQPRSVDDWVATIKEVWVDESGVALGGAVFVDEAFYDKAKKGKAHLGVSVRGRVRARPGNIDGQTYNVVESFVHGESVDFVTEAGARGGIASIAESQLMENDMDPKEMTLDQLLEANPAAFTEYAERMGNEEADSEDKGGEGLTLEQVESLVNTAVEGATDRILARVSEGEVANNRLILDRLLRDSKLPEPTQKRLRKEFHDARFDAVEATEENPARTGLDLFIEAVENAIEEARQELNEATEALTKVNDGGPNELTVNESGGALKTHTPASGVNKMIGDVLGVSIIPEPKKEEE